jgi:hypothetical protein
MDADSPWCRKIERAYAHLEDLKRVLAEYEARSSYIAVRDPGSGTGDAGAYRAKLVGEPSEEVPVIIGDFVHNLRSSLDHVAVALVPSAKQRYARFPIAQHDIWRANLRTSKDKVRSDAVARARKSYNLAVKGMPPEAQRAIENIQPLRHKGERSWLRNLHVLDLADKHHSILATVEGVENPAMRLSSVSDDPPRTHCFPWAQRCSSFLDFSSASWRPTTARSEHR